MRERERVSKLISIEFGYDWGLTFEGGDQLEGILSNRDDFGANAIAGEEGDSVAFGRRGGGAADGGEFGGELGGGFGAK